MPFDVMPALLLETAKRQVLGNNLPASHDPRYIYRSAQVFLKQHGQDAPIEAAMRADAMLDKGDLDGYAGWKRILRAVEELQGTVRKPGEAVH